MRAPLVSIVCLCYNHERFVRGAILSVLHQTYSNIQLIIVDDHSTDHSSEKIKTVLAEYPGIEFIQLPENLGNCRAFNKGLERAKGEFIIDLSADDELFSERIEKGILTFQSKGREVGVNFSDAQLINETGEVSGYHSDRFPHHLVPQGDVYADMLSHYFINSPTMMIRREVLDMLGGYDPSLAYEDFDFWVRSSRFFKYCYTPEALVKKRILGSSLGQSQYRKGSRQLRSTLVVCEKAFNLNRTKADHSALKKRIRFEFKEALLLGEWSLVVGYWRLWQRISAKVTSGYRHP